MEWYIGIDLSADTVQVSCMTDIMDEPETLSQVPDSEKYQIPICLAKKNGIGQWLFGEEAQGAKSNAEYIIIEDIYELALSHEKIQVENDSLEAVTLLGLFFQKLIGLVMERYHFQELSKLVLTVRESTPEIITLLGQLYGYFPIARDQISLQDYKESFYYYALSQKPDLYLHNVVLFDYDKEHHLHEMDLSIDHHTQPKVVLVKERDEEKFGVTGFGFWKKDTEKDQRFTEYAAECFEGKIISSAYLVGNGFDGDWMKETVKFLCKGRRVFLGKNLYTKGACLSARQQDNITWPFVFLGESKTKANLCMWAEQSGKNQLITLVSAGENWYETSSSLEIIVEDASGLHIILKAPDHSATKEEVLPLTGLTKRPNRTTRLRVEAKPESEEQIFIRISDLGFGEFFPSSQKVWEYRIKI